MAIIYQSPYEKVQEWKEENLFSHLFENNSQQVPSDKAIIDAYSGEEVTYAQLKSRSLDFAAGLSKKFGGKSGTIMVYSPNSALYPVLLFGGAAAGVTVSTANPAYLDTETAHALSLSEATILLVQSDPELVATAQRACKIAKVSESIYLLPDADGNYISGFKKWTELNGDGSKFKVVQFEKPHEKLAFLPFSSGTTGPGKGVCISHFNITSVVSQLTKLPDIFGKKDVVLGLLPSYHIFSLVCVIMQTIANGGTIVSMPKFELAKFCDTVQRYQCTSSFIVPPIALGLAKHPMVNDYDLSSLRFLICGAAPLSAALQESLRIKLKGKTAVLQGYGMTETTSVALLPAFQGAIPGSCGFLVSSMEARLVDADGKDVAEGDPAGGELWLRGPNIMMGYHRNEKATKETINEEGWMMTGDVCIRSPEGAYSIIDRTKELIKYSGLQVAPAELEGLLLTCDLVADCAVIGNWSEERATELPLAYVVPDPAHASDPLLAQKIMDFVAARAASHKKLRGGVRFIDVIPKSPSGKILRKDLRTLAAKQDGAKAKL